MTTDATISCVTAMIHTLHLNLCSNSRKLSFTPLHPPPPPHPQCPVSQGSQGLVPAALLNTQTHRSGPHIPACSHVVFEAGPDSGQTQSNRWHRLPCSGVTPYSRTLTALWMLHEADCSAVTVIWRWGELGTFTQTSLIKFPEADFGSGPGANQNAGKSGAQLTQLVSTEYHLELGHVTRDFLLEAIKTDKTEESRPDSDLARLDNV